MSLNALAIVLSSLGGAFELAGLGLVLREIADDRERGRRLLRRLDAPRKPERSYPGPVSPRLSLGGIASYGTPQTEKELLRMEANVANAMVGLKKIADQELDRAVERIQRDIAARDTELRDGLRYVLAGSTRTRIVGSALLALGIALSVAGSIVGTIA